FAFPVYSSLPLLSDEELEVGGDVDDDKEFLLVFGIQLWHTRPERVDGVWNPFYTVQSRAGTRDHSMYDTREKSEGPSVSEVIEMKISGSASDATTAGIASKLIVR
ncbi:unnamed protein product, partial [Amoebophrya sp. A25]